jgi:hypothetical protein
MRIASGERRNVGIDLSEAREAIWKVAQEAEIGEVEAGTDGASHERVRAGRSRGLPVAGWDDMDWRGDERGAQDDALEGGAVGGGLKEIERAAFVQVPRLVSPVRAGRPSSGCTRTADRCSSR